MVADLNLKVALYCRESTDDTSKAPNIQNQLERGKAWALKEGYSLVAMYADNGFSGGDWQRPQWLQCVKDAKRHLWKVLWVWNQDRLARDTEQFLWFYRSLKDANAQIFEETSNDFIDMETLGGRVKHQTMAQAAEIFRLVTSEKVKAAHIRSKAAGLPWGRKPRNFDVGLAQELRLRGKGWREIAKVVGVSYQTVRRVLLKGVILEHQQSVLSLQTEKKA